MSLITIWKTLKDTKQPYYITTETAIERIRSGKDKDLIEKIRIDPDAKPKLKEKLPAFSWSGTFKERKDSSLIIHSGLLCCDFDHCAELDQLRARIQRDKFTYICFLSPGNDGLKLIIKIPPDPASHKLYAKAIAEYYSDEASLDKVFDLSRLCFSSYDPDIYVNEDSEVWNKIYEEARPCPGKNIIHDALSDNKQIYENLKKWLNENGVHFVIGARHLFVFRLTAACNRFGIPLEVALPMLINDYAQAKDFTVEEIEKSAIRTYRNYASQYSQSHFDSNGIKRDNKREVIVVKDDLLTTNDYESDIIPLSSIRDKMISTYHTGFEMGDTTHFPELDKHWKLMRQHVVVFQGIGGHGKSTFAYQIALNKTIFCDMRWAIFSPEQHPPTYFYDDLIHAYIGKPSNKHFINRCTEEEYNMGMAYLEDKFFYCYPDSEKPTPEYILKIFRHLIERKRIDGVIIDPYNMLDTTFDANNREDKYISAFLTKCKRFAIENNIYFWIIAHPKGNLKKLKDSQDYERPGVYDLAGGGTWIAKIDDFLCIHRPKYYTDPSNTLTEFTSQKIKKHRLCGTPGTVEFEFDRIKNRYYQNGFNPLERNVEIELKENNDCPW